MVKINNEAKVCRSTRSVILGKAKVMSNKDFKDARAKRTASKGKCGCKGRKNKQEIGALRISEVLDA